MKLNSVSLVVFSAMAALTGGQALAAGYQFGTQSARNQGSSNAGALEAADASVLYYNPAGLSYVSGTSASIDLALVFPHSDFQPGSANTGNIATPTAVPNADNGGKYVKTAAVPHQYFSHQIDARYTVGLGLFVPYGSAVDFDDNFAGRYFTRSSDLKSLNINPSLAIRINDQHRLGFGLSAQYMQAEIDKNYNMQSLATGVCAQSASCMAAAGLKAVSAWYGNLADSTAHTDGHAWGYGYNLGYIYQPTSSTRLGIAYRSSIRSQFRGRTEFTVPTLPAGNPLAAGISSVLTNALSSADASLLIRTPETLSLSLYHQTSGAWAWMADVTYTRNSRLDQIAIVTPIPSNPNRTMTLKTEWRDTYKASLGASYQWDQKTTLRTGYMYDQGANSDARFALPTMPDSDRQWLSLGLSYQLSGQNSIDLAYSHIWLKPAGIARTDDDYVAANGSPGTLSGRYRSSLDLLSVQWNHRF